MIGLLSLGSFVPAHASMFKQTGIFLLVSNDPECVEEKEAAHEPSACSSQTHQLLPIANINTMSLQAGPYGSGAVILLIFVGLSNDHFRIIKNPAYSDKTLSTALQAFPDTVDSLKNLTIVEGITGLTHEVKKAVQGAIVTLATQLNLPWIMNEDILPAPYDTDGDIDDLVTALGRHTIQGYSSGTELLLAYLEEEPPLEVIEIVDSFLAGLDLAFERELKDKLEQLGQVVVAN